MSEIEPGASTAVMPPESRPHHTNEPPSERRTERSPGAQEQETDGPERSASTHEGAMERPRGGEPAQDVDAAKMGEQVAVTAMGPESATGEGPEDAASARALAEETRERMLQDPEQAASSVRDTAQEPAATRMSRAIDALS
ncbi:MAG: hypothetical protein ACOC1T_02975 [Halorhodospira sp.]